ncbi:MAG: CBS domain-containing protein [Candidatus Thermoplasmatota archaeon]|jgi:CBS domain-containing protein|nr:CBS domain-containing protein [Candidatus Thermoplasmatota archaeon]
MLSPEIYHRKVADFMSGVEISVEPLDPISEALGKMKKNRLSELPVMEKGNLKGLITFRNLARRRKMPLFAHVKSFMISPPRIRPTDRIPQTAERLVTRDFRSLPVTVKDQVKGMISRRDIINAISDLKELSEMPIETIMNFGPTTVEQDVGMKKALMMMELSGETTIAVVDNRGHFKGSINTSDVVALFEKPQFKKSRGDFHGESTIRDREVGSFTTYPKTLNRSDSVKRAVDLILGERMDLAYILEGDRLVGSVSEVDILEVLLRGPVTGGPLIQVAGLEDAKMLDASELQTIISKALSKVEKLTPVSSVTVRIRHHHHREDDDKYTVNIKVTTPDHVISRESYDYDLLAAIGNAFGTIEKQVRKERSKRKSNR